MYVLIVHSLNFSILIISTYCNSVIFKSECAYIQSQHLQPTQIMSRVSSQFWEYLNVYVAMLACYHKATIHYMLAFLIYLDFI